MVTVVVVIAFVAVASAVADEDTRNKVIGEEVVEKNGVDNTALLAADLDSFDLAMKIVGALEDEDNYYIDYQYKTLAIKDNVWQEVLYQKQMTVSMKSLEGRDLGLYVMEELGEIIDYQLAYLKEVQENEADKGETRITEVKEYTGLIGLVFDTETKELPGYEPIIKPVVSETKEDSGNIIDEEFEEEEIGNWKLEIGEDDQDYPEESPYQEWVEENVDDEEESESSGLPEETGTLPEPEEEEGDLGDDENEGDDLGDEEEENEEELIQTDDEQHAPDLSPQEDGARQEENEQSEESEQPEESGEGGF